MRRYVRLALPLVLLAAVAAVMRSRREVEVWHMAVADTPEPGNGQGP
ncbi:hypothetical protein [Mycobacterium servetii]|uniref:Uncharacterized protein n=1 Tax=Mycobacterium servetii TaxID=3237418 RepID=A0ABV4BUZ8_9MYCO